MRIEIWSDIVCPWCYIGKRRFERALATTGGRGEIEIIHRAYLLNPSMPAGEVRSHHDVLMAKYRLSHRDATAMQQRVQQTAADEGLEFHLAGGSTGNTFDAHRLVLFGRERNAEDAVLERLYRAHFTEQRSIFEHTSLVALAAQAGLDAHEARDVLAGNAYADVVDADLQAARRHGISGVPYYVIDGRHAISGAQPPELFAQVLAGILGEDHHVAAGHTDMRD
jgi:predicted DsbA family dithiol-disulfide isomerase